MSNSSTINYNDFAYDVAIPCALLFDKTIEPNCIKLYGFIKSLSRAHGYCFATNAYLANLLDCSEQSIRRYLKDLKDGGWLEIHTEKNRIHWQRHIYVGIGLKKCLRRLKFEHPPLSNLSTPPLTGEHHINRVYNQEKDKGEGAPPPDPLISFGEFVKLKQESYDKFCQQHGKAFIDDLIETINNKIAAGNVKPSKRYSATITEWIKKQKKWDAEKKASNPEKFSKYHGLQKDNSPVDPTRIIDFSNIPNRTEYPPDSDI